MHATFGGFIKALIAEQMHLAHQFQRLEQVQCAVDGGETDKGVVLLHPLTDVFGAQMFFGLFNDRQDHLALGGQAMALASEGFAI